MAPSYDFAPGPLFARSITGLEHQGYNFWLGYVIKPW